MPVAEIQAALDAAHARQADDEMGSGRCAFLFRPGSYGTAAEPLQVEVGDHTWVWRADHGTEGFAEGVAGDTERWRTVTGRNGVVVNGDDVTATGLFVEPFQEHGTVWNGERGTVVLCQDELPYDPPSQADGQQPDGTLGWAGYRVADDVTTHALHGGGVYAFDRNDPSIRTASGFEVPQRPGVRLHHVMTADLGAGTIDHVVDGVGGTSDASTVGVPQDVVRYP